jgi:murein DD-endopeptidase MepM/ murein hydrolase activator NlpD
MCGYVRTSSSPQVSTTPFLTFPIHYGGYTPYTAPVTAIMDHQRCNRNIIKSYDKDHSIRTQQGATYPVLLANQGGGNDYAILPPNTTVSTLFTYVGVASQGGSGYLQYDGHPAYDYGFGCGTGVYAAAAGTVMTDDDLVGSNLEGTGMASYYMTNNHALIINHGNGYCSIYMHLSSIDTPYVDTSNPDSWKPVKVSVPANAHIGSSGSFDQKGIVPCHFHFEVWRLDGGNTWNYADPYGSTGPSQDGTSIVTITPLLWTGN